MEMKGGRHLKINVSVPNLRLFVGNIPKSKGKSEILEEFSKVTGNLSDNQTKHATTVEYQTKARPQRGTFLYFSSPAGSISSILHFFLGIFLLLYYRVVGSRGQL